MTVALDRFGEPTVAWVEQLQENRNRSSVVDRIRAVFRRPSGHWSAIQVLGRSSAFINASPRVASAPDGTVALTYYAGSAHPGAMAVAWRSRGHVFGAPRTLGGEFLTDPALAFDSAGTMYLAGTRRCDAASRAVLYRATTAKRRQPDVWLIGKAPVTGVALGVTGKGSVALGWVAAACGGENPLGTPTGTTVDGSKIAAIRNLGAGGATNMTVAGSDVSWANPPSSAPPSGAVLTTRLASAAPAADPHAPAGGWVAVAADGGGDRLVRQVQPASAVNDPVGALPAGGSSVAPAPLSLSGWPWNAGAAAAAYGRGLALLTVSPPGRPPGLVTAAWRP